MDREEKRYIETINRGVAHGQRGREIHRDHQRKMSLDVDESVDSCILIKYNITILTFKSSRVQVNEAYSLRYMILDLHEQYSCFILYYANCREQSLNIYSDSIFSQLIREQGGQKSAKSFQIIWYEIASLEASHSLMSVATLLIYQTLLTQGGNIALASLNGWKLSSGVQFKNSIAHEQMRNAALAFLRG